MIGLIDIAPDFLFIVNKGHVLATAEYNPQEFGNATVIMEGESFSLRFERDRGQVFVDVGSDVIGWFKLEHVLEFLDKSHIQQQFGSPPAPALLAAFLQSQWDGLVFLFSDQENITQLKQFAKQKTAKFLDEIFGK